MRDKQTKNAIKIATETGRLYDKFANFVKDLDEVGRFIEKAYESYEAAQNKLSKGKGNILSKVNSIKKLGVTSTKQLEDKDDESDE
jgi:DNA recombination protein RmuC